MPGSGLLGLALVVLLGVACPAKVPREEAPPAPGAPAADRSQEGLREVVALTLEAKETCLRLARSGLQAIASADTGGPSPQSALVRQFRNGNLPDLAEKRSLEAAATRILVRVERHSHPDEAQGVRNLLNSQHDLCRVATSPSLTGDFGKAVSDALYDFTRSASELPPSLRVSTVERRRWTALHRAEIADARRMAARDAEALGATEDWIGGRSESGEGWRGLSPEEYRRQRQEWEEFERERERRRARERAVYRRAMEELRQKPPPPEEPVLHSPWLQPAGRAPQASLSAMRTWYGHYQASIGPFRQALVGYHLGKNDPRHKEKLCRNLKDQASAVLADEDLVNPPDRDVADALVRTITGFQTTGEACWKGRAEEEARALAAANAALVETERLLAVYPLAR